MVGSAGWLVGDGRHLRYIEQNMYIRVVTSREAHVHNVPQDGGIDPPPSHFFACSPSPTKGVWTALGGVHTAEYCIRLRAVARLPVPFAPVARPQATAAFAFPGMYV